MTAGDWAAVILAVAALIVALAALPIQAPHRKQVFIASGVLVCIALVIGLISAFGRVGGTDATSADSATNSASTTLAQTPTLTQPASSVDGVSYLDQYAKDCRVSGSIQRTGAASINGDVYAHTISQTPNGYDGTYFDLARKAKRFQAVVGPTDTALQGHRMQFALLAEDGRQIFISRVLTNGETESVDESVEGVLRLRLVASTVGQAFGGQGVAGWGDARVTGTSRLSCPV